HVVLLDGPGEDLLGAPRAVILEDDDGLLPARVVAVEDVDHLPDHVRAAAAAAHVEDEAVALGERALHGLPQLAGHVGAHEVPEVDDAELLARLLDDPHGGLRAVEEALDGGLEGDLLDLAALLVAHLERDRSLLRHVEHEGRREVEARVVARVLEARAVARLDAVDREDLVADLEAGLGGGAALDDRVHEVALSDERDLDAGAERRLAVELGRELARVDRALHEGEVRGLELAE